MKELLIQKYVDMVSKEDIVTFAKSNNIELCDNEINTIYHVIKKQWKSVIYGDYKTILEQYKDDFTVEKLQKIENLIILYKDKYKNYI